MNVYFKVKMLLSLSVQNEKFLISRELEGKKDFNEILVDVNGIV